MYKNKKLSIIFGSFLIGTCFLHTVSSINTASVLFDDNVQAHDIAIPEECLKLSDDKTILYGFKDDCSIKELIRKHCNVLVIPETVTTIAEYAFTWLLDRFSLNVTTIVLNDNLEFIGNYAFYNCNSVNYLSFDPSKSHLKKIGTFAFSGCYIQTPYLVFPNQLEEIADCAFYKGIYGFTELEFPSSLTKVGFEAFAECPNLCGLDFSNYPKIPFWLFKYNAIFYDSAEALSGSGYKIDISLDPNNDPSDDWSNVIFERQQMANSGCFEFPKKDEFDDDNFIIEVVKEKDDYDITHTYNVVKKLKPGLDLTKYDVINVPGKVDRIENNAFYQNNKASFDSTTSVTINFQNSLNYIGGNAFYDNVGIKEVNFNGVETIYGGAFHNTGITSLTLSNIDKVNSNAFSNSTKLKELKVDSSCKHIYSGAFAGSGHHVTTFDFSAFDEKEDLPYDWENGCFNDLDASYGKIIFQDDFGKEKPESIGTWVDDLGDRGLRYLKYSDTPRWIIYNRSFTSTIPEEQYLQDFDTHCLYGLTEDTKPSAYDNIVIPDRIETINNYAFLDKFNIDTSNNSALNSNYKIIDKSWQLAFNNGLIKIGAGAFANCKFISGEIQWPRTLQEIGDYAFAYDNMISGSLIFPDGLKRIGKFAFFGCSNIYGSVTIPSSIEYIGEGAFGGMNVGHYVSSDHKDFYVEKITFKNGPDDGHKTVFDNLIFGTSTAQNVSAIDLTAFSQPPTTKWICKEKTWQMVNPENCRIILNGVASIDDWYNYLTSYGFNGPKSCLMRGGNGVENE